MRGQPLNTVMVLGLVACAAACTRLPPESLPGMPGSLPVEILDDALTIPAGWGTLAAVSSDPISTNITRLWVEDEEGTIRLVSYNNRTSRFHHEAVVIRRR